MATGGLSIVAKSLYGRLFSAKDPCALLEKNAEEYLEEKHAAKQEQDAEQQESAPDDQ